MCFGGPRRRVHHGPVMAPRPVKVTHVHHHGGGGRMGMGGHRMGPRYGGGGMMGGRRHMGPGRRC